MPDKELAPQTANGDEKALDPSKNVANEQPESNEAQPQRKMVSPEAFDKAVARLTAEKWDLKRTVKEREDEIQRLKTLAPSQTKSDSSVDQEFNHLLGDTEQQAAPDETQSDINARIDRLENAQRLQRAANQLQELHERFPEVDTDKVLGALQRDGKEEDAMELYFLAERGRIADQIRAHSDAESTAVDKKVADNSTEGPSRPMRKELYDEIEDDVEAFKAYRRSKVARTT
jgi:hypothetical protein